MEKAKVFLEQRQNYGAKTRSGQAVSLVAAETGMAHIYAFNASDDGYVIVSANDGTVPILGYSDTGHIDGDNMPPAMKRLLESYDIQPAVAGTRAYDNVAEGTASERSYVKTDVAPMIKTKWGQEAPYNNKVPKTYGADDKLHPSQTGCVTTAMAQVLYYYQWPKRTTTTITSYNDYPKLEPVDFNWDAMQLTYDGKAPTESQDAVATLNQYCSLALRSSFSPIQTASHTEWAARALYRYFGYEKESLSVIYRDYMDENEWFNLLYQELAQGRPVIIGGDSHEFVCDGYQTGDYYHINWGWDGKDDGYFLLDNRTRTQPAFVGKAPHFPDEFLMGMKMTNESFSDDQARLATAALHFAVPTAEGFSRTGDTDFPEIPVNYVLKNVWSDATIDHFDIGFGLYQDNQLLKVLHESANVEITNNTYKTSLTASLAFGQGLADGTYTIYPVSREAGAEEWLQNEDTSPFYIQADIAGDKMTVTMYPCNLFFVVNSMKFEGKMEKSQPIKAIVNVTNPNLNAIQANIVLTTGLDDDSKDFAKVYPNLAPGETKDLIYEFAVNDTIKEKAYLWCDRILYGDGVDINIEEVEAPPYPLNSEIKLEKTFNTENVVKNEVGTFLYGHVLNSVVSFKNPSATNAFYGNLGVWFTIRDSQGSDSVVIKKIELKDVFVLPNATYDVKIHSQQVDFGKNYVLMAENDYGDFIDLNEITYTTVQGVTAYLSDDTILSTIPAAEYTVPEKALCVEIGEQGITKITPNANPNCLYILSEADALPTGITEKNVIRYNQNGATAEELELTDGYGFMTSLTFFARKATYVRTFATQELSGYTTLMLPFTATAITANGQPVALQVYEFTGDQPGKVYADEVSGGMPEAGTPYLVKITDQSLAGQPVTFTGQNTVVPNTYLPPSAGNYQFVGTLTATKQDNTIELFTFEAGKSGTSIPKQTECAAFRAYFRSLGYFGRYQELSIEHTSTGIFTVKETSPSASEAIYDLQGRRINGLPTRGIYIKDNRKVLIK